MPYSKMIECVRFGQVKTRHTTWGCCAVDLLQNFSVDPNEEVLVPLFQGDSGTPSMNNGQHRALGPTNKEAFEQFLRIGSHNAADKPNRLFLVVITDSQLTQSNGKAWLAILKENGFQFQCSVDNSVYTGSARMKEGVKPKPPHLVHLFYLLRHAGAHRPDDPFAPPAEWLELEEPIKTPEEIYLEGKTIYHYLPKDKTTNGLANEAKPAPWALKAPAQDGTDNKSEDIISEPSQQA